MENVKFSQNSSYCYKSTDNKIAKTTESCGCGVNYYEYWIKTIRKCEKCLENDRLKKENRELKEQIELAKVSHEDFIDKSENWHREQLAQKDEKFEEFSKRSLEENDHLKNKLQTLEEKFNELETKYSELIIKED